jgi:diaminohydroxyphosphoribosylaminopyrimidine deaminase/5-amino-6-(5-phosphoribosylamino)uracil reductase
MDLLPMIEPLPSTIFDTPEMAMRRAIALAKIGIGHVEPNPPVGAVVVDSNGLVVGQGWHKEYGGPHAEVHALNQAGDKARGGTLFVTLEPCCHHGKTPPCTDAVIASGVERVHVAVRDSSPWNNGQGIELLRQAGIEVTEGTERERARELVEPFFKLSTQSLPWVHAKWAMTLDGKLATRDGDSQWISNEESRAVVHELRGRMDAILIGIGTALMDDPLLTARPAGPRTALRVVLDSAARLPLESQLAKTARDVPLLLCVGPAAPAQRVDALRSVGVEVLTIGEDLSGTHAPPLLLPMLEILQELGRRKLTHVLIEGGSDVLGSAFDARLIDEVHVFVAPTIIGGRGATSPIGGLGVALPPRAKSPATSSLRAAWPGSRCCVSVRLCCRVTQWTGTPMP